MRQAGATPHRGAGTALHRGARASHHRGPPRRGAQAPDAQAQQLWLTGPGAPRHAGSSQTRARTRVPRISRQTLNHCATREALFFFYTASSHKLSILYILVYICQSQSPNSSHHPTPATFPPCFPYVCSLHLCLNFCAANWLICTIFLGSTYMR